MTDHSDRRTTARAYGVVVRDGHVLLVRAAARTAAPGAWWLPGGGIDFGESPEEAVVREVREETGLSASQLELLDVISERHARRNGDEAHSIRIIYRVGRVEGELRHEVDGTTDLAAWVALDDLNALPLSTYTRAAVARATQTK
jgi:ADP-ribose pyrophosphatase YjhB (NUDIX family)